jgi:hypothetical protein
MSESSRDWDFAERENLENMKKQRIRKKQIRVVKKAIKETLNSATEIHPSFHGMSSAEIEELIYEELAPDVITGTLEDIVGFDSSVDFEETESSGVDGDAGYVKI